MHQHQLTKGFEIQSYRGWVAIILPQGQRLHFCRGKPIVEVWHAKAETDSYFGHDELLATLENADKLGIEAKLVVDPHFRTSNTNQEKLTLAKRLERHEERLSTMFRSHIGYMLPTENNVYLISTTHLIADYARTIENFLTLAALRAERSTEGEKFKITRHDIYEEIVDQGGLEATTFKQPEHIAGHVRPEDKFHLHSARHRNDPYFII